MRAYMLIFKSRLFTPEVVEHVAVSGNFDLVGVGGVGAKRKGSARAWILAQTEYWGWWGTFWIVAATILRAIPEKLRFPRPFRRLSSIAATCDALEIPYEDVDKVNDPEFLARLRALDIDVLVCFQQQIFKRDLLTLPKAGCLNVHTGILPGYRGFKPVFWMHSRGEPEMGVSVHTMTEDIDTGRVVVQRRWRRRPKSSVLENQFWGYRNAAHCIVEAVERLPGADLSAFAEVPADSPYFKAPTKEERDRAVAAGTRLV